MKKKEPIVAIIPARGGSKSIPRKNLKKLGGMPLVAWPIQLAQKIKRIDHIIVSTEDDEIRKVANRYGAETPFKRPPQLAQDKTPTLPVLQHCLAYLKEQERYEPSIVLLLYPTAPFLAQKRVEHALDLFEKTHCNSVLGVIQDWGRFWRYDKKRKGYAPLYPPPRINRQYYKPLYRESGSLYFSRTAVIMKMNKIIDETSVKFVIMEEDENIDIDTLSDFHEAKKLLNA